jgi:hypothetical protein
VEVVKQNPELLKCSVVVAHQQEKVPEDVHAVAVADQDALVDALIAIVVASKKSYLPTNQQQPKKNMQHRSVPVYLPRTKTTILTPKPLAKLVFELNYKGLVTSRCEIDDNQVVLIEFQNFEEFRRNLYKWMLKETPANTNMWEFLKNNVSIEIVLKDVDPTATPLQKSQPYTPIIRFDASKIDEFCNLYYSAKFQQK